MIDLHSGRLLPPEEGRLKLVTASLPDPYDPDATHPDVDRLTGHLPQQTAEWLWQQLAYCRHGQPARTFVAVTGPPGGGKSTLARAVQAALGPAYAGRVRGGGDHAAAGRPGRQPGDPGHGGPDATEAGRVQPRGREPQTRPARVKALTGGDLQTWRPLYGHPRHGIPTASLWLLGNQAPTGLGLTDPAMAERIRAVPYPEVPENEQVDGLIEAFDGNSAGARKRRQALVAKLVRLAAAQAPGWLPKPVLAVLEAVDRLREEDLGPVGVWLRDDVSKGDTNHVLASADLKAALWEAFEVPTDADRVEDMTGRRRWRCTGSCTTSAPRNAKPPAGAAYAAGAASHSPPTPEAAHNQQSPRTRGEKGPTRESGRPGRPCQDSAPRGRARAHERRVSTGPSRPSANRQTPTRPAPTLAARHLAPSESTTSCAKQTQPAAPTSRATAVSPRERPGTALRSDQ